MVHTKNDVRSILFLAIIPPVVCSNGRPSREIARPTGLARDLWVTFLAHDRVAFALPDDHPVMPYGQGMIRGDEGCNMLAAA